jgi:hypothetical protein
MMIKMLIEVRKIMQEQTENFNIEIFKSVKIHQREIVLPKNTTNEMKN